MCFIGVLFNIAQSLPSHVVFEMFQAIGNIFGKVLSFDICQYVQTIEVETLGEKLNESKECEMVENGQLQNGKVHDETDKVDVNKEVGNKNSFICNYWGCRIFCRES
jgi:hypothetical protein